MEDRRIRKTKKAFYNALIELLRQKEVRNISIQELCDLADSHRSTFYYHYSDIYGLYEEMEDGVLAGLSSALIADDSHAYSRMYDEIITRVYKDRAIWGVLLGSNGDRSFKDKVSRLVEEKYLEIWRFETDRESFSDEFCLLARANVSAFITLLTEWLKSGDRYSKDEVKSMLRDMNTAIDALLGKYL